MTLNLKTAAVGIKKRHHISGPSVARLKSFFFIRVSDEESGSGNE